MKIKKNKYVKIISGNFKGKQGKVIKVMPKKQKAIVQNVAFIKKHIKPKTYKKYPEGGIVEIPQYIHISNLVVI